MYSGGGSIATGYIEVHVTDMNNRPIADAMVRVYKKENENFIFETLTKTNIDGKTITIILSAPSIAYSYEESQQVCPYETYNVEIKKDGYDIEDRIGVQIFANCKSILPITMVSCLSQVPQHHVNYINDHKLYHSQEESQCSRKS